MILHHEPTGQNGVPTLVFFRSSFLSFNSPHDFIRTKEWVKDLDTVENSGSWVVDCSIV